MMNELSGRILYCDANCIVVNKIAGEAVEGAGKGMIDLPKILADQMPGLGLPPAESEDALALPTAVHRLDVPVSGCVLFARTATTLNFLNKAFRGNAVKGFALRCPHSLDHVRASTDAISLRSSIEKRYWAIVEQPKDSGACRRIDELSSEFLEFIHWIQFNARKNKSTAHNEQGRGRNNAVLRCRLAGRGRDYLFLEIDLITGRHHQIRAQFEKLGLHIKGDLKYGARRSEKDGGIRLHARSLSFPDAADSSSSAPDRRRITVQADPPIRDNLWQAFQSAVNDAIV